MKMRKRRQINTFRDKGKFSGTITLYHQRISRAKFDALPEADRYCFLLLGHVHDELSWLQRMAYVASRSGPSGKEVEKSGNMMQATLLARLLLGKLFEFQIIMGGENSTISKFIANNFRPGDKSAGTAKVKAIIDYYIQEKWIRAARNKHFLHYPTQGDVTATLNDPEIEWEPEIYHGKKSSNTFYPTSDVLANYSWFRLANPEKPMEGFDEALHTIRDLANLTMSTLEQTIGYFVDEKLAKLSDSKVMKLQVSESIHEFRLNYFMKT